MLSRFESLRYLVANVAKLAATRNATAPAPNLLLHTSAACQDFVRKDTKIEPRLRKIFGKKRYEPPVVAVVLSGLGDARGSSTLETISLIIHLHRQGIYATCFAPTLTIQREWLFYNECLKIDIDKIDIPKRRSNVESARLAFNHSIKDLPDLEDHTPYKALIIPGGAGVSFVLSDFLDLAEKGDANPFLRSIIKNFHSNKKPIGTISYAGLLVAKVIPGVRITMRRKAGTDEVWEQKFPQKAIDLACAWNAKHIEVPTTEMWEDIVANVYSTPGSTVRSDPRSAVFDGIGKLVDAIKRKIH